MSTADALQKKLDSLKKELGELKKNDTLDDTKEKQL